MNGRIFKPKDIFGSQVLPGALKASAAFSLWQRVNARLGIDLAEATIQKEMPLPILEERLKKGRYGSFSMSQKEGTYFSFGSFDAGYGEKIGVTLEEGWSERVLPLLLEELLALPEFVIAYQIDALYFSDQHETNADRRRSLGFRCEEHRLYPTGLPAPLPTHDYDCDGSVGRLFYRKLYLEIPAARLWLGEPFWRASGADEAAVRQTPWLRTRQVTERVLQVDAWPSLFASDRGIERERQIKLRRLLFPNTDWSEEATSVWRSRA